MYNKILVPLDGSQLAEEILPYARIFAEACAIHHSRAPVLLIRPN
jgi:hypothetical protein